MVTGEGEGGRRREREGGGRRGGRRGGKRGGEGRGERGKERGEREGEEGEGGRGREGEGEGDGLPLLPRHHKTSAAIEPRYSCHIHWDPPARLSAPVSPSN